MNTFERDREREHADVIIAYCEGCRQEIGHMVCDAGSAHGCKVCLGCGEHDEAHRVTP